MHPKTLELAREAGFVLTVNRPSEPASIDWSSAYDQELEKLVELVIEQCAQGVQHIRVWNTDLGQIIKERYYGK